MKVNLESFEIAVYSRGNRNSPDLALVLPGRMDSKDYPHMKSHVELLASLGYYAISFDPPGTWESGGDISLYSMTNYLKAINQLIGYFGNKPTLLVGHSRGGSMAMLAGTTNLRVTAFVSIMSGYSYTPQDHGGYPDEEWQQVGFKLERRDDPFTGEIREFKLPHSFLEDQIQYNMLPGLKSCAKPKLFIYGEVDVIVEPEEVKYAYQEAAKPKSIRSINSPHDYRKFPEHIKQVNNYISEFLLSSR